MRTKETIVYCHGSVTKLGDLFHFGQLFKASWQKHFAQIAHISIGNFCKVDIAGHSLCLYTFYGANWVKIFHFYRHLATF